MNRNSKILLLIIMIVVGFGCSPLKLSVAGIDPVIFSEYGVEGRHGWLIKQKLSFGPYHSSAIKRSWTGTNILGLNFTTKGSRVGIGHEWRESHQAYSSVLTDSVGQSLSVTCASNVTAKELKIGDNNSDNIGLHSGLSIDLAHGSTLYIELRGSAETEPLQLLLDNDKAEQDEGNYSGRVYDRGKEIYRVVPVKTVRKSNGRILKMYEVAGYEIRDISNTTVGAVSLIDQGKVYLRSVSAGERRLLAGICSAILLRQALGNE